MLVLEKGNKDILFVDASKLIQRERRNEPVFTEENQGLLEDILENKKVIEDISFTVQKDDVLSIGDWSIARYKKTEHATTYRVVNEINRDLEECYSKLAGLHDANNKLSLFQ